MKVGILSDIHGNYPALKAVIDDLPQLDQIICCGDLVGYYPDVNEVCSLIRDLNIWVIRGNHDAYLTGAIRVPDKIPPIVNLKWTREVISNSNFNWLQSLPNEIQIIWDNKKITIRHASPWDEETYLYRDSSSLDKIDLKSGEILIVGHTHYPMYENVAKGFIINPGSVGQPRDRNPLSSYAIYHTELEKIEFKRVAYPIEDFKRRLNDLGWSERLINKLEWS